MQINENQLQQSYVRYVKLKKQKNIKKKNKKKKYSHTIKETNKQFATKCIFIQHE